MSEQVQKDKAWAEAQTCPKCGSKCEFDYVMDGDGYTPFVQCQKFSPLKSAQKKGGCSCCSYREAF